MKMEFQHIAVVITLSIIISMPVIVSAATVKRVVPFCKKHHRPCTLKHRCVSYYENNARLFYSQGEYYNYKHDGGYYNYISNGKYYAYVDRGTFYNYFKDGNFYAACKPQRGHWEQGKWVVPQPVCK